MRSQTLLLACACVVFAAAITAEETPTKDDSGVRTWTSTKGDTIQASFEKFAYGSVYLKKEDGNVIKIKKTALSAEDQSLVDKLSASASGSAIEKALAAKKNTEADLPKAPQEIVDLFGDKLRNADKKKVPVDALTDKVIGIYFSAHWCPPCRAFTPELVKFYDKLKADGKPFEIVFVSSDKSEDAMFEYMEEMKMKWLALPHGDKHRETLSQKFGVRGIPMFVVVNSKGETITTNGRGEVMGGTKAFDEWEKKK